MLLKTEYRQVPFWLRSNLALVWYLIYLTSSIFKGHTLKKWYVISINFLFCNCILLKTQDPIFVMSLGVLIRWKWNTFTIHSKFHPKLVQHSSVFKKLHSNIGCYPTDSERQTFSFYPAIFSVYNLHTQSTVKIWIVNLYLAGWKMLSPVSWDCWCSGSRLSWGANRHRGNKRE